jgi:hypothetical protein
MATFYGDTGGDANDAENLYSFGWGNGDLRYNAGHIDREG